jgi:hypothetical protein
MMLSRPNGATYQGMPAYVIGPSGVPFASLATAAHDLAATERRRHRARGDDGRDGQAKVDPRTRPQRQSVHGARGRQLARRGVEQQVRRPEHAVAAAIRQPHDGGGVLDGEQRAARLAAEPAHLEDVGEVRRELPAQHHLVRRLGEALHRERLVELVPVHGHPPREPDGAAEQRDAIPLHDVGVGQVDRDLQRVGGERRVQYDGPLALQTQLEASEEPRAVDVEAELAARQVGEITSLIRDEKAVLVLQDQLREVGGHAGRDDVVRITAGSRPFRMLDHRGFTRRSRARGVAGIPPRSRGPSARP